MTSSTTRLSASVRLVVSVWFIMIQLQGAFGLASISNNSQSQQRQLYSNDRFSQPKPIPITVLSGFLGSGKTTLLQHLLQNKQGLRIAIIVNDVASVNIDSKLIMSSSSSTMGDDDNSGASGMVQLQNGCACCSKSEELLSSVSELVMLSDMKGEELGFQHIVVEMSGVADPKSVRAKFQEALLYDMPLMDRVRLDTMVTVVDCSSFLEYLVSAKSATPNEAPELFYPDGQPPPKTPSATDWMDDLPAPLLEALLAGDAAYSDYSSSSSSSSSSNQEFDNGVSELLVGQTETADVLLLNKVDLVQDEAQLEQISSVVAALNPRAKIYTTQYGNVELSSILGVAGAKGVVEAGIVDDHRDAVEAAKVLPNDYDHDDHSSPTSSHSHDVVTDSSHSHSHDHTDACKDSDCTENHSHGHHDHQYDDGGACADPGCTDPSHSHSHSHSHQTEGETHAGIGTFVYRARRPFHPQRLLSLLRKLPVKRGLPEAGDVSSSSSSQETPLLLSQATCDALKRTLRSKGFIWCADSNIAALYWSHAGASFDLQCLGRWWSTLPRDQWPPEAVSALMADFDDPQHSEDNAAGETVGDRRQEIVFIGQRLGQRDDQKLLQMGLDRCLLNDDEWASFRSKRSSEDELQAAFLNPIPVRMVSY